MNSLDTATQAVVEKCISEVISEYTTNSKYFTADSLHYIRSKITSLIHERLGKEHVNKIDVGLNLSNIQDIPFFFKIDVPIKEEKPKRKRKAKKI